jgi:hypothetical protein
MANPYHHACSSAKRWGGIPEDYQALHDWFDASKEFMADFRHRALRHHAQGIFECERVFGHAIKNSAGRMVPVRWIGEQHVQEDCGRIPTIQDWFQRIRPEPWMGQPPIMLESALSEMEQDSSGNEADRWHRHVGKPIGAVRRPRRLPLTAQYKTQATETAASQSGDQRTEDRCRT